MSARSYVAIGLLALIALSGVLRFVGLDYMLPLVVEPDAHMAVQVRTLETGSPTRVASEDWPKYPHLVAWLTALTSDAAPLPPGGAPLEEHLAAAQDEVLRVRVTVAWLSLLIVPVTWLLARRFTSGGWALVAAGLAGTSLLAVHFGTQARPHGASVAWFPLTVLACMRLAHKPTTFSYVLVALAGALAMGGLQSAAALAFPVLAAHLLGKRSWAQQWKLIVPALGLVLAIVAFYPFFLDQNPLSRDGEQVVQGGHKVMLNLFNGGGLPILARAAWSWEPALCVGLGLALVCSVVAALRGDRRGSRKDLWVVLAFVIPYGGVILLYERSYERFLLPLLPFAAVWVGWALGWVSERGARWLAWPLALVLLAFPTAVGVRLAMLRLAPSTLELAAQWLEANVESESTTVWLSRPSVLPLYKSRAAELADLADKDTSKTRELNWISYQRDVLQNEPHGETWQLRSAPLGDFAFIQEMGRAPAAYLQRLQPAGILVQEVFEAGRVLPQLTKLCQHLRSNYERLARFGPGPAGPGEAVPLVHQDVSPRPTPPWFAWRILRADRMGPALELFDLRRRR